MRGQAIQYGRLRMGIKTALGEAVDLGLGGLRRLRPQHCGILMSQSGLASDARRSRLTSSTVLSWKQSIELLQGITTPELSTSIVHVLSPCLRHFEHFFP